MAHTLISKPSGYALADDLFYYQIQNTAIPVNTTAVWSITLTSYTSSNTQNIQLTSVFDATGNTFVEISQIVNAFVTTEKTFQNAFPQLLQSMSRVAVEINYNSTTYDLGNLVVISGEFTKQQKNLAPISGVIDYSALLINYVSFTGKPASPATLYGYPGGSVVLSWYQKQKPTATSYQIRSTYYLNGAFESEIDFEPTNFSTLMLNNPNELFVAAILFELPTDIDYDQVEVSIIDNADASTSTPITIYPLQAKIPEHSRHFVWLNNQGGFSSIQTVGDETYTPANKSEVISSAFVRNNYTQQHLPNQVKFNQNNLDSYETQIGYLLPQHKNILRSILDSSNVWLLENEQLVSVKILQNSLDADTTATTAYGAKIKWEYTYK